MKREPFLWEGIELIVKSPEGASTIENVPGATIETAYEVARLLERAATRECVSKPPNIDVVLIEIEKYKHE